MTFLVFKVYIKKDWRKCKGKNMIKNLLVEFGFEELLVYVVILSEK